MEPTHAFEQMTSDDFLHMFIDEARRIAPFATCTSLQSFIRQVVFESSANLENRFRKEEHVHDRLDPQQYAELIVDLKNSIGGAFSVVEADTCGVHIHAERCPFGSLAETAPGLCHMTSSIFGGIAARNFGYAKVELVKRIAMGADSCDICIHLDPQAGRDAIGDEYFSDGHHVIAEVRAPDDLQRTIEERLHALWTQDSQGDEPVSAPERPRLVAESPQMRDLLSAVDTIAPTRATVLLQGETGVGKEVLAKSIHSMSPRLERPFVPVNCGSLPAELVESELFGHEAGAFTDAKQRRAGRFETANGGTLFLDEVDSLSPKAQVSLLRILQEGRFERVGGHRPISCDVRVIAASNRDLESLVAQGDFRKDLYYRLNVVPLHIPPLRERREDIAPLAGMMLARLGERYHCRAKDITPDVMRQLEEYDWPGNVRELENVLERACLFTKGDTLDRIAFSLAPPRAAPDAEDLDLRALKKKAADNVERQVLVQSLEEQGGDVRAVAELLDMTPRAVYQKLTYHGLKALR
jgi:two-component system response regulator HydG